MKRFAEWEDNSGDRCKEIELNGMLTNMLWKIIRCSHSLVNP